jgi:methionine synthase / methylenetetrahydrofolate reductase (NADH)
LETFRDVNEIGAAIRAVRSVCDLPIVAQVTTEDDGNSLDGAPPESFVPALEYLGAQVVGLNCSVGPAAMLETIERMAHVATVKLSAQPNAGRPREVEGRNIYLCSPEYMASYARRFINNGVRLVGGCCGTSPEHIRHIKNAVRELGAEARTSTSGRRGSARVTVSTPLVEPVARAEKSRMANGLSRGAFTVSVELVPPRGFRVDALIERARQLRIHGVDLVNVPDGPRAGARMSALSAAVLVQQQSGIETILHCACRDRNLLGLQSDLLGAHSMGVRNLLLITGDPPQIGDYPDATAVMDVDSIGLTNMVKRLNDGADIGDQTIGAPTAFHIGVAVNPAALDPDEELRRFEHKVKAGAEFAITQLVFDHDQLASFLRSIESFHIPVLAAIAPLESLRHAEFLANELPGVSVPDAIVERMRRAETAGRASAEGMVIAREIAAEIRPLVQGIQISPAGDSIESALGIVEAVVA